MGTDAACAAHRPSRTTSSCLFQSGGLRRRSRDRRADGFHHRSLLSKPWPVCPRSRPAQHAEHRRRRLPPVALLCVHQRLLRLGVQERLPRPPLSRRGLTLPHPLPSPPCQNPLGPPPPPPQPPDPP